MILNHFDLSVAFLNLNEEILFNFNFFLNLFIDFCSKIKTEPFGTVDVNADVSFSPSPVTPRGNSHSRKDAARIFSSNYENDGRAEPLARPKRQDVRQSDPPH